MTNKDGKHIKAAYSFDKFQIEILAVQLTHSEAVDICSSGQHLCLY